MLEQILDFIHNYFVKDSYYGEFVISEGVLRDIELLEGQYFKVKGSVFNDGVHQNGDTLTDETFNGTVYALGIPKAVLDIAQEVDEWMVKYGDAVSGPFQSESFGGYSYSKGSDTSGSGKPFGWQTIFGRRLNAYRKVNGDI